MAGNVDQPSRCCVRRLTDDGELDRPAELEVERCQQAAKREGRLGRRGRQPLQYPLRNRDPARLTQQSSGAQEDIHSHGGPRRHSVIGHVLRPNEEGLLVGGRVEEGRCGFIPERRQHFGDQAARRIEPLEVEGRLVQAQQSVRDCRLILEVSGQHGATIFVAAPHPAARAQRLQQESRIPLGGRDQLALIQRASSFGKRAQHQAVPGGDNLLVPVGVRAPVANSHQAIAHRGQHLGGIRCDRVENVPAFEIASLRHVEGGRDSRCILVAQRGFEFSRSPQIELSLLALAVGVETRVKAAFR